jgi:hypothetical protein
MSHFGERATHGIRATYARGVCRLSREEGCPGHPETGISCREAWRIARREPNRRYVEAKKGEDWVDGRTVEGRKRKEEKGAGGGSR